MFPVFRALTDACEFNSPNYNFRIRDMSRSNLMISFLAIGLWQVIPYKFEDLNQFAFTKL